MHQQQGAAALIATVFFLGISLLMISGFVIISAVQVQISRDLVNSKRAIAAAESGLEEVAYQLIKAGSANPENLDVHFNYPTPVSVSIDVSGNTYTAYTSVHSVFRKAQLQKEGGTLSFDNVIQVGEEGFDIDNVARVAKGRTHVNSDVNSNNSSVHFVDTVEIQVSEDDNFDTDWCDDSNCLTGDSPDTVFPIPANYFDAFISGLTGCLQTDLELKNNSAGVDAEYNYYVDSSNNCIDGATPVEVDIKQRVNLVLQDNLYIDGDLTFDSTNADCGAEASGDNRFIIVTGEITIKGKCNVTGDRSEGSDDDKGLEKIIIISLKEDIASPVITAQNNSVFSILYAENGFIDIKNESEGHAVYAKKLNIQNNVEIQYWPYLENLINASPTVFNWREIK